MPLSRHHSSASTSSVTRNQNNFAQSVGPGLGRSNSNIGRAKTSMSFHQPTHTRHRSNTSQARPQTAMNTRPAEDEAKNGKKNCMMPPPARFPPNSLQYKKLRKAASTQMIASRPSAPFRDISISTMMGKLSLEDERAYEGCSRRNQAILDKENQPPSISLPPSSIQADSVNFQQSQREESRDFLQQEDSRVCIMAPPRTPHSTDHAQKMLDQFGETLLASTRKFTESPTKSPSKVRQQFLTKDSNMRAFTAWDVDERLFEVEAQFKAMKEVMNGSLSDKKAMEEVIEMAKTRGRSWLRTHDELVADINQANDLERERNRLDERNLTLQNELDSVRQQVSTLTLDLEQQRRSHKYELEDKVRSHRHELEELKGTLADETERINRQHQEELEAVKRHYRAELDDEKHQTNRELEDLRERLGSEQQGLHQALQNKDREIQNMCREAEMIQSDLDRERTTKAHLQKQVDELIGTNTSLEGTIRSLQAQVHFLESDSKQQSDSFAEMEGKMQEALKAAEEARQKLIKEETERRVLFNKYQELKGNIRVMCRVRPSLDNTEGSSADLDFPDEKTSAQIAVRGPEERNSLGKVTQKTYPFEFDRVFTPQVQNEDIFGEISQLVQSALDGYNVCIFCYGQTGSGKTYTMSSADGMIPRATKMIYETVSKLKEKSWNYTMEGNFIEVYNEELNDLLTSAKEQDGKRKLEIRHDEVKKTTTVLNCKSVTLDSENTVELMLNQAQKNRSVAATKSNERSSRSHSVFTLKLVGENSATHERCEGTLNLVDLAGSERLKQSGAEGDRMKETQNINASLKSLGDVIEALGSGQKHIPYRNSKLTYLLRYSLGGNSKTLMFVMVSPLEAHLNETLSSLRFATKVSTAREASGF